MKTKTNSKRGNQLWGVYHADRAYARKLGNPLRTVIEAPTKIVAEETALRLGFPDPRVTVITPEIAAMAQWQSLHRHSRRREQFGRRRSTHIRV